jgi:hypothetical protein
VSAVNLWFGRTLHRTPMLTSGKVRELFHPDWVCRADAIRRALQWEGEVRFADGLRLTFADRLNRR